MPVSVSGSVSLSVCVSVHLCAKVAVCVRECGQVWPPPHATQTPLGADLVAADVQRNELRAGVLTTEKDWPPDTKAPVFPSG